MQKIRFNSDTSNRVIEVRLEKINEHRMKCIFHSPFDINNEDCLRSGFKELNENNLKVQGNFNQMKYIYHIVDDKTVIFTSKADDDHSDNNVQEELETLHIPTVEEIKQEKIDELSSCCNDAINSGLVITIREQSEHFTYKLDDQANIKELFDLVSSTKSPSFYKCKMYTVEEIIEIYTALVTNKMHHLTYFNQLKSYVKTLNDIEEIKRIYYGQILTGKYLELYQNVMEQTKRNITDMVNSKFCSQ